MFSPSRLGGLGSVVSSPSEVCGGAPAKNAFLAYFGSQNTSVRQKNAILSSVMRKMNIIVWKLRCEKWVAKVGSAWEKSGRAEFMGHGAIYSWGHSSFVGAWTHPAPQLATGLLTSNILKTVTVYHDGVNESRIWNVPWAIDWHHDFWPWMILNCLSSRSSKLHVIYFLKWWQIRWCCQ